MAVHMIRVVISTQGKTSLDAFNAAMDDWVSEQSEWMEDPNEHNISEVSSREGGASSYYAGTYRFHLTDAKDNLIQKCEDKLVNKCPWWRLGYHVCDHDQDDRHGCSWDEQREWTDKDVTIPPDVPTFVGA